MAASPDIHAEEPPRHTPSKWSRTLRNLRGVNGLVFVALFLLVAVAVFADFIAPASPPSSEFWLGTDEVGRDVVTRVIYGARTTLYVGVASTLIATVFGVPMGVVSGYFGGKVDAVMMRITDGLLAFPPIILAMVMVAVLEPSLNNAVIAIGVVQIPRFARLVRGVTLSVRREEFMLAAEATGGSNMYVMRRTIVPNVMPVILVQATLTFATAVLTEAGLSFLGLGAQPPEPSWGLLLNAGRALLSANPGMAIGAGGAIFISVLVFTLLGDVLSDLLNPRRPVRTAGSRTL